MELTTVLSIRRSTRTFLPNQITEEQLDTLLSAAKAAPVCMGQYEKVRLIVLQSEEKRNALAAKFGEKIGNPQADPFYAAPTVIYILNDSADEEIVMGANASCIAENILLAATDLGLGSVYLFGVSQVLQGDAETAALLEIPDGFRTVAAVAVGKVVEPFLPQPPKPIQVTTIR